MNPLFLPLLAKQILAEVQRPVSKVKFAKIIYFVFKDLVIQQEAQAKQLAFIRMPLGPVPHGFMDLDHDADIVVSQENIGLVYNRTRYSLKTGTVLTTVVPTETVQAAVEKLEKFPTSELVQQSHKEPSWLQHVNGSEYYLSAEDLETALFFKRGRASELSTEKDNQLIQSSLLNGMEIEVVQESAALEYPDFYSGK